MRLFWKTAASKPEALLTQKVLADKKNQKVYLFKEMYLLQGNSNGLNGYVKEIKSRNGVPHVCNIITLDVDHDHLQREDLEKRHDGKISIY